jgi:hypothetical protein
MGTANLIEKWKCDICGDVHDDEDDARDCCPRMIDMVYVCSECGKVSDFYYRAINSCYCEPPDPDAPPPPPSAAELETAGQTRLF